MSTPPRPPIARPAAHPSLPPALTQPAGPGSCVSAPVLGSRANTASDPFRSLSKPRASAATYAFRPSGLTTTSIAPRSPRPETQGPRAGSLTQPRPVSSPDPARANVVTTECPPSYEDAV